MFERVGGELGLRAIVDDFVDRVFDDAMMGFFFRGIERKRIKELELQHAAEHLGGPVRYRGRKLDEAHAKHRIMGGQFARRLQLLRETLQERGIAPDIIEAWIAHDESLRPLVTADPGGQCND
jgi:hemoglobin